MNTIFFLIVFFFFKKNSIEIIKAWIPEMKIYGNDGIISDNSVIETLTWTFVSTMEGKFIIEIEIKITTRLISGKILVIQNTYFNWEKWSEIIK